MRGLTMLLVVYAHMSVHVVRNHHLCNDWYHYWIFNNLFQEFRMPLFFFISGFVLFKTSRVWNWTEILNFFKKKIPVQLLFPFVCMCACLWVTGMHTLKEALFMSSKSGYWFTFVLLEYYVLYIILEQIPLRRRVKDVFHILVGVGAMLACKGLPHILPELTSSDIWNLLSLSNSRYFMYFIFGVQAHKHFPRFERFIEHDVVIITCIVSMFVLNMLGKGLIVLGIPGVLLVFAFFRRYQHCFTKERRLGRTMQYVGRHTLDIYLLHYFFLPTAGITIYKQYFYQSAVLQLVCMLICSAVVIGLCLLVSNVLRLSPFIAHYCFGAKREKA